MNSEDACKFTDHICRLAPVIPVLVIEDATIAEPVLRWSHLRSREPGLPVLGGKYDR